MRSCADPCFGPGQKEHDAERVIDEVESQLRDGMSTPEDLPAGISGASTGFGILPPPAYQLKQAVMGVGPLRLPRLSDSSGR